MTLTRSKKSAVILSTILVLSFALTTGLMDIVIPFAVSGDPSSIVENPENLSSLSSVLSLLTFLALILLVLIAISSLWIYRFFGERHYGNRSPIRWALIGFTFAIWMRAMVWIFQGRMAIIQGILQFFGIFVAYFVTRRLIPLERPNTNDSGS